MGSVGVPVKKDAAVPIALQLGGGESGRYPRAYVFDDSGSQIAGSPFDLGHVSGGLYKVTAGPTMTENLTVQYHVYEDAAHTIEDETYDRVMDYFKLDETQEIVENIDDNVERLVLGGNVADLEAIIDDEGALSGTIGDEDTLSAEISDDEALAGTISDGEDLSGGMDEPAELAGGID